MVINEVYIPGVALIEAEDDAPIAADRNAPKAFEPAFQQMQVPAWKQPHFTRRFRCVQGGQHVQKLFFLARRHSARVPLLEQTLEPFVPEALDGHPFIVYCKMTFDKPLRFAGRGK